MGESAFLAEAVFSACAEVVPVYQAPNHLVECILRVRGGSSGLSSSLPGAV